MQNNLNYTGSECLKDVLMEWANCQGLFIDPSMIVVELGSTNTIAFLRAQSRISVAPVCGIYALVNLRDHIWYIGQSIHAFKRLKAHINSARKVPGPNTNCLYEDMFGDNLDNFGWCLLEAIPMPANMSSAQKAEFCAFLNSREQYFLNSLSGDRYNTKGIISSDSRFLSSNKH